MKYISIIIIKFIFKTYHMQKLISSANILCEAKNNFQDILWGKHEGLMKSSKFIKDKIINHVIDK